MSHGHDPLTVPVTSAEPLVCVPAKHLLSRAGGLVYATATKCQSDQRSLFTASSAAASLRTVCYVLASTVCYYVATQIAWTLTFPDSKVSLFFPPQAVLLCILLLVPTRHWWAYVLTAVSAHFLATQQAGWPALYALNL